MKIGIINIGDELLSGKILNTNQFDLSQMLSPIGHEIIFAHVVGDNLSAIVEVMENALAKSQPDVLIITGGLGPTQDDLTREALAKFLHCDLVEDANALIWLGNFLGKDPLTLPVGQKNQANIPKGTDTISVEALHNPTGTACGIYFLYVHTHVYAFPGVPSELKIMTSDYVIPKLNQNNILLERSVWTIGWSEGSQREAFAGFHFQEPFRFSSLPNQQGVRLSLSCLVDSSNQTVLKNKLEQTWEQIKASIPPDALVDVNGTSLLETIFSGLISKGATVSVAESCTGGLLGSLLTELPGSSKFFQQGFLTYSDQAKCDLLGVKAEILNLHGAVSEVTASAMATGCLRRSGADYGCAITGIAGPDGGTVEKPVGTVWIAVAANLPGENEPVVFVKLYHFRGNRSEVRYRSCFAALNQLRLVLTGYFEQKQG